MSTPKTLYSEFTGANHAELAAQYELPVQQVYHIMHGYHRQLLADRRRDALGRAVTRLLASPHSDRFLQAYLHELLVREAQALAATDVLRKLAPPSATPQPNPASTATAFQRQKTSVSPTGFPSLLAALQCLAAAWGFVCCKYRSLLPRFFKLH